MKIICNAHQSYYSADDYNSMDPREKHVIFASIAIKCHAQPLIRIAEEMHRTGYKVSFATHESGKDWVESAGIPFISAGSFPIAADSLRKKLKSMAHDTSSLRGILTMFNDIYVGSARPMYTALLDIIHENQPDLLVIDVASIGAHDLAHKFEIPYIVNSPSIMFDLEGTPSYVPAWGTGFSGDMSLWNRCMNLLFPRLLSVALTPPFMQMNKVRWEFQLPPYRSQHEVFRGTRVLVNTAFGLDHPQPLNPLVEMIGPIIPGKKSVERQSGTHSLPDPLEDWFRNPNDSPDVVYVNLGSMAYIEPWQMESLVEGLKVRHSNTWLKVFWLIPPDQALLLPDNLPRQFKIKFSGSIRPFDILSKSSVSLVVSNCGMVTAQEALVFKKPLLCIPFIVDQPDVAARIVDVGAGLKIHKNNFNALEIQEKLTQLHSNFTFRAAASEVGSLLGRAGGLNRAVEVIDSGLRLGFDHLKTVDLTSPWHKTVMLDIWAVYAAIFCLMVVFIRVHWLLLHFVISEVLGLVSDLLYDAGENSRHDDCQE
jgi:UDP:flavonoid glycosyltransferase YjiC (YdhE family)